MKRLTSKGIESLVPYPPGKPIEELERELGITGSIKLASNENPLGPSPLAVEAILKHINTLHRYPDGSAYYLTSKLSALFGLPPSRIILGNGSNQLIELIIRTFLLPGEHAIQGFPTFLLYDKMVTGTDCEIISIPLSDYRVDLEAVSKAVRPNTKILFINNPNNPTGSALLKEEMTSFLNSLPEDIIVVLDEAYIEFASDPDVANGLDMLAHFPRMIVLRTFSKLYGLAGLRIGYGFASEEMIDYMNRIRQPFNTNTLAQVGAAAALDDMDFVRRTLEVVREGLAYLYRQLDRLGLEYIPTQTNFFLIKMPRGAKKGYESMLREGVIVRSMDSYGLQDHIRVNVGLHEENERFIRTLEKMLH